MDRLVPDEMNRVLCALVEMEEVKVAVFQLGTLKVPGLDLEYH